jgi:hypothetical protein
VTLNLKGGEIGIPPDNWKSWILTVINNLQPTHKVLLPIYKIVADGPKRENIKRAIREYSNIMDDGLQKQISDYRALSFPSPIC